MKMPSININVENRDKTFINKRSKLETLLGNIKNKANNTKVSDTKDNLIQKTKNFKTTQNLKNKTGKLSNKKNKKTESIKKCQNRKNKIDSNVQRNNVEVSQSHGSKDGNEKKNKNDTEIKVKSENKRRNSDSFNLSDFEDDILKNLENIDIPIEKLDDDKNLTLNIKKEDENFRRNSIESNLSENNMTAEYLDMSVFDDDIIETKMEDLPKDIVKTEKNIAECENFDCINIKKEKTFNSYSKIVKPEYVTVYKIINNEINNEVNELKIILAKDDKIAQNIDKSKENNGKINNYYKQCKKIKLNNKNVGELTKTDVTPMGVQEKSILISESDAVRYCFICSSIFDKENCDYCEKKGLKKRKIVFSCDVCGLKVNTKQEMIKHLEEHKHNIME